MGEENYVVYFDGFYLLSRVSYCSRRSNLKPYIVSVILDPTIYRSFLHLTSAVH